MNDIGKLSQKDFWRWIELKSQFIQYLIKSGKDPGIILEQEHRVYEELKKALD